MPLDPAIKSLISQFRKSPEWDEHLDLELLQKLWPSLVGEQLARVTRITAIHVTTCVLGRAANRGDCHYVSESLRPMWSTSPNWRTSKLRTTRRRNSPVSSAASS